MADRINESSLIAQVEFAGTGKVKASSLIGQVEFSTTGKLKASSLLIQVEFAEPEAPAGPTMTQLMRHGTWFGSGVKQRMWWAK